jgi:acetyl esterase
MLKSLGGLFEAVTAVRHLSIPSEAGLIPAWLYLPGPGLDYPLFLYFHGGGFVTGDLFTADNTCRFLCRRAGLAVLSVDYRLAPESPFPAAVEDCLAATRWAADHGADLHVDVSKLFVGGDSAGGTLAAVIARLCSAGSGPRLLGQALFYPSTLSTSFDTPSFREFGEQPLGLTRRDMEWFLDRYATVEQRADQRVSPLLAGDLSGLPQALVVTAEYDVLRDEGEAYTRRLEEAGVPVRLMRCNGMVHGFASMIGFLRRATLHMDAACWELRRMVEREEEKESDLAVV